MFYSSVQWVVVGDSAALRAKDLLMPKLKVGALCQVVVWYFHRGSYALALIFFFKESAFPHFTLNHSRKISKSKYCFSQFTSTEDKEIVLYTFKDLWCTMSKSSYDTFIGALLPWHWFSFLRKVLFLTSL